jgi:DNA-binding NarL/FixJ family response regulator
MAASAGTQFGKKILHIAFEPQLHGVQRRLMETSGYNVLTVLGDNGVDELDLAALAVNVVVVDCSAPFEQRWALVRSLKLSYPEIPVIALRKDTTDDPISLADHNASLENPADWLHTIAIALV